MLQARACGNPVAKSSGVRTRILVVEDQATNREAIVDMFEREPGFSVRQASSLAYARLMLDAGVDVAILDLRLPDGSGTDLIRLR